MRKFTMALWVVALLMVGAGLGAQTAWATSHEAAATEVQKLNINSASAEELTVVKGIGEVTAQAIVDYRENNGPFRSYEDLLQVKGIGESKLEALRAMVVLE